MARVELGERIATLREEQALTQAELAERARISPSTLSLIESGKVPHPQVGTIRKIARALGVEPQDLRRAEEVVLPKAETPPDLQQSLNGLLEEERREATYRPWLDFINRYADRWEQRIKAGEFDLGSINEFVSTFGDLAPTMTQLGLEEKQEQPPGYRYTYGPIIGEAVGRLFNLLNPLFAAASEKFEESELTQLRQKRAEQEAALKNAFEETG
jgi:transcriptional regulator with XRE-family HTH domain